MSHRHQEHDYLPAMGNDRLLPLYDAFTWLLGVPRVHRRLVELAAIEPGHRVLEIGCGTGNLTLRAQRMHPDAEVMGIDPDPLALERARRKADRAGLPVRWDRGKAGELPYADESVDRVLSAFMFHHLDDAEKKSALAEVRRALRPRGRPDRRPDWGTRPPPHHVLPRHPLINRGTLTGLPDSRPPSERAIRTQGACGSAFAPTGARTSIVVLAPQLQSVCQRRSWCAKGQRRVSARWKLRWARDGVGPRCPW
jgi:SAM-dependent methyltransferase